MDLVVTADGEGRYVLACPRQMEWNARVDLVQTVRDALTGREVRAIIVDLEKVSYLNSAGLGGLFALRKFAHEVAATMVIARPNHAISRLLKTVNLTAAVPVVETLDEARLHLMKVPL